LKSSAKENIWMYNRLNVSNLEYYITKTLEIVGYAVLSGKQSLKSCYGLGI